MSRKEKLKNEALTMDTETLVKHLESFNIEKLGTDSWFDAHRRLNELTQVALFEAEDSREEHVKDLLILYGKLPVLLQEALCISVWKEKVLPLLLQIKFKSGSTLIPYLVLFHEALAASLLETVLFYPESCDAMGDSCNELIEYCIGYISLLVTANQTSVGDNWFVEDLKEEKQNCKEAAPSLVEEILQQKKKLEFEIGVHCFTIISYLSQNIESLPLNAAAQLFEKYDVPLLFVRALEHPPWIIENQNGKFVVYTDTKWKVLSEKARTRVIRIEAQVWMALRQLMLNPEFSSFYEITTFRRNELIKVYPLLVDTLIDQIPPLSDFKMWLGRLMSNCEPPPPRSRPLIVEVTQQVKSQLAARKDSDWKRIAKAHATCMVNCTPERMQALSKRLSRAYETYLCLEKCPCAFCNRSTTQRCSRCKETWYCSRDCQVNDWSRHKTQCISHSRENRNGSGKSARNSKPSKEKQVKKLTDIVEDISNGNLSSATSATTAINTVDTNENKVGESADTHDDNQPQELATNNG